MQSFATAAEAAHYLKLQPVKTQCTLTGGGTLNKNVRLAFHRQGLRVKVEGNKGLRTVTLTETFDPKLAKQRKTTQDGYRHKHDDKGESRPVSQFGAHLELGESVVCTGANDKTIRAWLSKNYGPWTCTVDSIAEGWKVTRQRAKPDQESFRQRQMGKGKASK